MNQFIEKLKQMNVHTEKLAIARFLIALSVVLTLLFNDMNVIANHHYTSLPGYVARAKEPSSLLKKTNIFYVLPPGTAKVIAIAILLFVMTGFFPDISCLLHLYVNICVHSYFVVFNGGDQVAVLLTTLLVPVCMTDPRRNQWKKKTDSPPRTRNIIAVVAMFAIQFQAAIIYLYAGVSKVSVPEWQEGTALYYYASNNRTGAPDWLRSINELITLSPLVVVLSWGVIVFEILLFACLFASPRVKHVFFVLALIFHALIVVNFGLVTFFFAMAALLVLFLDENNASIKLLNAIKRKLAPSVSA